MVTGGFMDSWEAGVASLNFAAIRFTKAMALRCLEAGHDPRDIRVELLETSERNFAANPDQADAGLRLAIRLALDETLPTTREDG